MCKVPAEIRLCYIDKILGEVEHGLCTPEMALIRISVWARFDKEDEVIDKATEQMKGFRGAI